MTRHSFLFVHFSNKRPRNNGQITRPCSILVSFSVSFRLTSSPSFSLIFLSASCRVLATARASCAACSSPSIHARCAGRPPHFFMSFSVSRARVFVCCRALRAPARGGGAQRVLPPRAPSFEVDAPPSEQKRAHLPKFCVALPRARPLFKRPPNGFLSQLDRRLHFSYLRLPSPAAATSASDFLPLSPSRIG